MAKLQATSAGVDEDLLSAQQLLKQALAHLDAASAPSDIGAHVAMALERLKNVILNLPSLS